jgi:hypothetical protein
VGLHLHNDYLNLGKEVDYSGIKKKGGFCFGSNKYIQEQGLGGEFALKL